jgi:hypothetical protein
MRSKNPYIGIGTTTKMQTSLSRGKMSKKHSTMPYQNIRTTISNQSPPLELPEGESSLGAKN